jgi:hypothetical protein
MMNKTKREDASEDLQGAATPLELGSLPAIDMREDLFKAELEGLIEAGKQAYLVGYKDGWKAGWRAGLSQYMKPKLAKSKPKRSRAAKRRPKRRAPSKGRKR